MWAVVSARAWVRDSALVWEEAMEVVRAELSVQESVGKLAVKSGEAREPKLAVDPAWRLAATRAPWMVSGWVVATAAALAAA